MFLTAVVLVELAFVGLDSRLQDPLLWYSPTVQEKAEEIASGDIDEADVLFIGSSMTDRDVDVDTFESATGIQAWNGGIPGAQVSVLDRWLVDQVIPASDPDLIVLGLSSLELNDGRLDPTIDRYERQLITREDVFAQGERSLMTVSAFYRHRQQLRTPLNFLADITGDPALSDEVQAGPAPVDGFRPGNISRIRETVLNDYSLGGRETEALEALLSRLESGTAQVVVVWMPVPERYVELHPGGVEDFEAARTLAASAASDSGALFIDLSRSFDDASFADLTHLSDPAAVEFTTELIGELEDLDIGVHSNQ